MSEQKANIQASLDFKKAQSDWLAFKSSMEVPVKLGIQIDDRPLKSLESTLKALNQITISPRLSTSSLENDLNKISASSVPPIQTRPPQAAVQTPANINTSPLSEQSKHLDSMIDKFTAYQKAYQTFGASMMDSNFLKGQVKEGNMLSGVLGTVIDTFGGIPNIARSGYKGITKNLD